MKTHDLALNLQQLARALRALPNVEVGELRHVATRSYDKQPAQSDLGLENVPSAISMLLALGDVPKSQWISLIQEYSFPIDVKAKDGSRDIMDRILRFLQNDKEARSKLSHAASSPRSNTSPELQRALQILLRS